MKVEYSEEYVQKLIAENARLQLINKQHQELNGELRKEIEELEKDKCKFKEAFKKRIKYCNELEKDLFENCSNYVIPKSKIEEKIKLLSKQYTCKIENHLADYNEWIKYNAKVIVLQELLESEE